MSRSRKKTPITGNVSGSEKVDKQLWHRRLRRATRQSVSEDPDFIAPDRRDVSDVWAMQKDGKHWWPDDDMRK